MYKHYGGIPDGVSPFMLCRMIEQGAKWDVENQVRPLWYLRVISDAIKGEKTEITIQDMIQSAQEQPMRDSKDITDDFMRLIERDRREHG